jgi:hypothetical protein
LRKTDVRHTESTSLPHTTGHSKRDKSGQRM